MEPDRNLNVGRYLRFVIAFLLIVFGALGAYEYYYGAQAQKANELQQQYQNTAQGAAATSSDAGQ